MIRPGAAGGARRAFGRALLGLATALAAWALYAGSAQAAYGDGLLKVLVMGDSYSAGNGAGSYEGATGCRRSPTRNYGGIFASIVNSPPFGQPTVAGVAACSGAVTSDIWIGRGGRRPQIEAMSEDFDVVFLTIGGNDLKFAAIVRYCLIARDGANCGSLLTQAERALRGSALKQRVAGVLTGIGNRAASGVRIVLLGYPYLEGDPSYRLRSRAFGRTFIQVGKRLRAIQAKGDRIQRAAVEDAGTQTSAVVLFEPTKQLFAGPPDHTLFAKRNNPNRWFVQPFVDGSPASIDTWYHPNPTGWAAEGRLLADDPRIPKYDAAGGEIRFPEQLYDGNLDLPALEDNLPPAVMPDGIKFGSGQMLWIDSWEHWGDATAIGHGTYGNHGDDRSPGTVVLSNPQQCGKYVLYTQSDYTFSAPDPGPDYPRPTSISLLGSCY